LSGRNFSLKEMETPFFTPPLTQVGADVRKELLSERDGNVLVSSTVNKTVDVCQEGTSL